MQLNMCVPAGEWKHLVLLTGVFRIFFFFGFVVHLIVARNEFHHSVCKSCVFLSRRGRKNNNNVITPLDKYLKKAVTEYKPCICLNWVS